MLLYSFWKLLARFGLLEELHEIRRYNFNVRLVNLFIDNGVVRYPHNRHVIVPFPDLQKVGIAGAFEADSKRQYPLLMATTPG